MDEVIDNRQQNRIVCGQYSPRAASRSSRRQGDEHAVGHTQAQRLGLPDMES